MNINKVVSRVPSTEEKVLGTAFLG